MAETFLDRFLGQISAIQDEEFFDGSRLSLRVVGPGELRVNQRRKVGELLTADAFDCGCGIYMKGVFHPENLTFIWGEGASSSVFSNGLSLSASSLQLQAEGSACEQVSVGPMLWRSVSVNRRQLQAHAKTRVGRELCLPAQEGLQVQVAPALLHQLGLQMEAFLRGAGAGCRPGALGEVAECNFCRDERTLMDTLLELLGGAEASVEPRGTRTKRRIFQAVEAVTRLGERSADIDSAALSGLCGASERLIEQAMRDTVGMSPKRWLTLARFNRVHAELQRPDTGRSVTEVAMHWGFMHLGRFAINYRNLFGESPSETVSRVRQSSKNCGSERRTPALN